jgi:nitrate/nitrite transport system permease protein
MSEPTANPAPARKKINVSGLTHTLGKLGLGFFVPIARLAAGDNPKQQLREISANIFLPAAAIGAFLLVWTLASQKLKTDSLSIPSPKATWAAYLEMREFSKGEAVRAREFADKMEKQAQTWEDKAAKASAAGDAAKAAAHQKRADGFRDRHYAGPPTFGRQIYTSLVTVGIGFLISTLIAVPVGILCGLSKGFNTAVTPLIQIFKPVSPLAWLPIVFVIVTVLYEPSADAQLFGRALFISAGTVTLCSLWPTLINTAVGVANVDKDHLNVARVLRLDWFQKVWKIILPSALPMIFTGLRLSLGVGWMVLIAADMLAQNPGLGKFVWDTFQNGSSQSMAQILVAVIVIGLIGFLLDRVMLVCQKLVSFEEQAI